MRYLYFFLSLFIYPAVTYSTTLYSCDVFNNNQKIATLSGSLNNSNSNRFTPNTQQADPNTALAFTLCQQAGLKPVNVIMAVPDIHAAVQKSQLLPNPACTLKCTPL